MPAIASISRKRYTEHEILKPECYAQMRTERLTSEGSDEPVIPVRNKESPHFRRIGESVYAELIQEKERDETHQAAIRLLMDALVNRAVEIVTPVFDENNNFDPDGQVLFGPIPAGEYHWWDDGGGTRIPVGNGRYIQPDICGRPKEPQSFWPSSSRPNIIIEVVQTHLPEEETLYELLRLSELNYLIVFFFVAPERRGTKYSRVSLSKPGHGTIRAAHYITSRQFLENGNIKGAKAPLDSLEYKAWYEGQQKFLKRVMRAKNDQPNSG